jgi:hypothetical protein
LGGSGFGGQGLGGQNEVEELLEGHTMVVRVVELLQLEELDDEQGQGCGGHEVLEEQENGLALTTKH